MDVRQFAFLAGQPSAALKNREHCLGLPKRGLAIILANAMFWQPLLVQADGIAVSGGGTTLGQAGNGVPIVNIAAPNAQGLSHNQFTDYNVGANGVILNNATARTQSTQLGGIILGNQNLNGTAANIILNEVNGASPSQLRGYTEVAGQSAHVIVANPYGISCNGCGFINTPQATLTTGKPVITNGQLTGYQVDRGSVSIDGAGLNASNIDQFEIITRSAKLNAEINAKKLAIIAGANDVDAKTLKATARAANPADAPQLAIDSSALGGMYAGAIRLVGTEAGVGVKLDGKMVASGGDIQLDANGHLSMVETGASGAINVKAASLEAKGPMYAGTTLDVKTQGDLTSQNNLVAKDRISLTSGGQLTNNGIIEAGVNADKTRNALADVSITAQNVTNNGQSVIASRDLNVSATQALSNQGGTLSGQRKTTVVASTLDNQNKGRVISADTLNLTADTVLNAQGGLIKGQNALIATLGHLNNNAGEVSSQGNTTLILGSMDNLTGLVMANNVLDITASGAVNNQNGRLGSNNIFTFKGQSLDNTQKGRVTAQQSLDLTATHLDNTGGSVITNGPLNLTADTVDNATGRISSQGDLTANVTTFNQQDGALVTDGKLSLTGSTLDNRNAALISAKKLLTLNVGNIDNRAGEISSVQAVNLNGQSLNNSEGGKVLSDTALGLKVAQVINQSLGQLVSQGSTTLTGSSLDNSGGKLSAQSGLVITLDGALTNQLSGLISSEGTLTAHAASLDNSGGSFSSAGQLSVTSAGVLINQGGRLVTDGGIDLHSASLDNRYQGTISGQGPVSITTGNFDNSHSGFLSSADHLDLTTAQLTNQDGGRIGAAKALTAKVSGLDQQGGELKSDTSVALDLNHGQLNNQGGVIRAPLLVLNNLKDVNNQGGEISSAQAFTLAAASLNNDNGQLLSNQPLTLRIDQALSNIKGMIAAAAVDVRAGSLDNTTGTLSSRAGLELTVDGQLINQNLGLISATNGLTISSAGLNNQGGRLQGSAISLDLANGDLNNAAGHITTDGQLSINRLRDLNNQGGELTSAQSLNLIGRTLDNSNSGKLISNNQLTLTADNLINQNAGLLSGWQGVTIKAGSLDNSNSGTVSSRSGNVDVTLSGALLNSNAGALASQQALTIKAVSLDNSAGTLSSAGAQSLTVTGLLSNGLGGLIDAGTLLTLNAMALNNNGTVQAQQALSFTGTDLDNSNGSLSSGAAVTLDLLGTLTNTHGKLSGVGPLVVQRSNQINNQGGELSSQSLLTLLTGGLDSSNGGLVSANDKLLITSTGTVQNGNGGLIASRNGDLQLTTASLGNGKGSLQGKGAVSLDVSGDIDNQSGKVIAQDSDLFIKATNLDSRGGLLSSISGALTTRVVGVLKNGYDLNNNRQGGLIQAQRLDLQAWGGLDNYGGRIAAQTGDALVDTGAGDFDNRNGAIHAQGLVQVSGNNFDNSGDNDGQISGRQINLNLVGALNNRLGIIESDSTLSITAASLDNQTGQLRALGGSGKTEFQIGGLFDNSNGKLETANSDLTLGVGSFMNQGGSLLHLGNGTFDTATANITNAGGSFITRGGLTLTADSWTNSSVIQAGRLTLNVNNLTQTGSGQLLAANSLTGTGGNWNNDGLIASDGNVNLSLGGSYTGNGRLSSLGTLGLSAAQLSLGSTGSIAGGGDTTLNVGSQLNNSGRITSAAEMSVSAGGVNNYGTLGSSKTLSLSTPALLNDHGLIFSGSDMDVRVNDFTNDNAALYSLGNLNLTGTDGGRANSVKNLASTISVDGDFLLATKLFDNRVKSFETQEKIISGDIRMSLGAGPGNMWDTPLVFEVIEAGHSDSKAVGDVSSVSVRGDFLGDATVFSNFGSVISAGKNIRLNVDSFENASIESGDFTRTRNYVSSGDPWALYNRVIADYAGSYGVLTRYAERNSRTEYRYQDPNCGGGDAACFQQINYGRDADSGRYNPMFGVGPEVPVPAFITNFRLDSISTVYTRGANVASIVQAGQAVEINAKNTIQNGVLYNSTAFVGKDNGAQNTAVEKATRATVTSLNSQLPPDLAKQQVNPLSLPGFTLPSGSNGLFRLSGQSGSGQQGDQTNAGLPNWNIGDTISTVARQQSLPNAQVRGVQLSGAEGVVASVGGQNLTRVQGLPDTSGRSNPQKYLIETNPVLTDLKQFMSSDYLLAGLGYKPDESAKRLGDGFYEQKLIQQAVVARTGQRFIDGQTSDEKLFKYLMDNAISSKQQLDLSVGVSLTAQQVAALTHDIVWMERQVVNGEEVLVPVLYLAQATNRLAPNGALIQGTDVTLIAGENLESSGTLRASNNLKASADNDLVNNGLIESANRLDLLAGNSIVNKSGGIIAGRDVSLTATHADVLNQRDISHFDSGFAQDREHRDLLDSSARIEASNNLSISAGRDISNSASVLSSGSDMKLSAGRDVNVNAVAERTMDARGDFYLNQQITQHGAVVTAGRDLQVSAGRDISAIASAIESKRDMALASDGDIRIESAANESQFASRGRSTLETRSVSQQSSELKAGGNISVDSGKDLDIIASRIKAGGDIALDAVQDMTIASAKNESSYYYYKKSSGSFGRSSSKQVESYDSTNVASVIDAGHDLTVNATKAANGSVSINGGRDLSIIGSKLKAGDDLILAATNNVAVLSGVEEHGSYSKKTSSGFLGLSKSGKSQLQTTASQVGSELDAGNDVVVASGNDIRLRASQMAAGNDVELRAGLVNKAGDINLVSANDTAYSKTEEYKKKTGLSVSGGFISFSSAKEAGREAQSSTSVGSHVIADRDATLQAERDINVSGSGIKAGRNVSLDAGRDVNVVAAQNSTAQQDWEKKKQSGIGFSGDDNGITAFVGTEIKNEKNRKEQQTAAASQIDAGENLTVNAKRDINQVGSDLRAANDINLASGRNINIDAARETLLTEQQREVERNGVSATINHNFGKTKDAVNGAGKGEDDVSKGSSTLKAVDAVSQFLAGPTADDKIGNSKQSATQQVIEQTNRSSTLNAGNDLNITANNDVLMRGGQLDTGRDINIKGRDITLDVAKGSTGQDTQESQSWGGIHGGTSGGFKVGIGGSHGVASGDSSQSSSAVTQLGAGRDVNLQASNDLSLIGTQVNTGRDIDLNAGNELNIRSAQNSSSSENNRSSGGGEVGFSVGSQGVGVYASVSLGKGNLEREGEHQQEAYLYAGDRLSFTSGKDTNIKGANLRGNEVVGRVGGDLNVSSAVDTGTVKGKEFDINATVTVGLGVSASGSVGYGETAGKTNWVQQQTSITAKDKVDVRTESHTQIDGALIASDSGNLKLDTRTLGFSDIAGKDKEHGYYLNIGGSYNNGDGGVQDSSQVGKGAEGKNGWSIEGYNYEKDRQQIVRATVGAGEVAVRKDAETGSNSVAGLNRNVDKSYEVTRDKEKRTDIYASGTSVAAVLSPKETFNQWQKNIASYGEKSENAAISLIDLLMVMPLLVDDSINDKEMKSTIFYMQARENRQKLMSSDPVKRAEVLRALLVNANVEFDANAEALLARLTDMSGTDLNGALKSIQLLAELNKQEKLDVLYFGPLVPVALGAASALGALLASAAATPENLERMREAANAVASAASKVGKSATEQARISIELWKFLFGTHFPGFLLNDENQKLVNPIVDIQGPNPASGGFLGGAQPSSPTNTGGSQIVDSKGTGYTNPVTDLPSPDVMYNSDGSKITYGEHAKIRNAEGRPVGLVVNDIQTARPSDILVQDDGRWVIKGGNGRIHILEPNGEVVTSFSNPNANTNSRIQRGEWARASQDELKKFENQFSDYVKW